MKLKLVNEFPSHDTVEALKMLLSMAENGNLRGVYFVGYMKRKHQVWGATGVAYDDPTDALGPAILPVLEMALRAIGKNDG